MWTWHRQMQTMYETGGPHRISPFFVPMMIADIAAGYISIRYGLRGPNYATTSACATSSHAIADAFMLIERGDADVMLTGGSEASICPMGVGGFNAMKALSTRMMNHRQQAGRSILPAMDSSWAKAAEFSCLKK